MKEWVLTGLIICMGSAMRAVEPKDTSPAFEALAGVPEGVESRGVVKPSFTDGILSSLIEAATVTKVADDRLEMTDMKLRIKGDSDAEDVEVLLSTAGYDLRNQVLTSNERSLVHRSDFTIEGDSLVFDTAKSVGRMNGNIVMVIQMKKPSSPVRPPPGGGGDRSQNQP